MRRDLVLFLILLAGAAAWAYWLRESRDVSRADANFAAIPYQVGTRTAIDVDLDPRSVRILRADQFVSRIYAEADGRDRVHLFVAYFGSQRTGSQIHSPQNCLPGSGWRVVARGHWKPSQGHAAVNEFIIAKGSERQLVHYWYVTRAGITDNEFRVKLDLVMNAMLARPTDAALVRTMYRIGPDGLAPARRKLRDFFRGVAPIVARAVPIAPQ